MYDCPIEMSRQLDGIEFIMREERERTVLRAIQKVGIDIDRESLMQALNHDRERYEEAYQKGYNDCKRKYDEILKKISDLVDEK